MSRSEKNRTGTTSQADSNALTQPELPSRTSGSHPIYRFNSNPFLKEAAESIQEDNLNEVQSLDFLNSNVLGSQTDSLTGVEEEKKAGPPESSINAPPEKGEERMDPRRSQCFSRNERDVERKKLEAELRATEEIAKIKQSVIEKRLALELASLKESPSMRVSQSRADLRSLEEMAMRKQIMIENNLAQELKSIEFQKSAKGPRPPPPIPSRHTSMDGIKPGPFKSDFLTQTFSNTRNSTDARNNPLAMRISANCELRNPLSSDGNRYMGPPELRYPNRMPDRNVFYARQMEPGFSEPKTSSGWKTVMSKLKRAFRQGKHKERWDC